MTGVLVTGLGVLAPNGMDAEEHWRATLEGRSGISRISRFDVSGYPAQLAGQIQGFDAQRHLPGRLLPQTDRVTRLALVAADAALADAGVDAAALPEYGMGVVTSNASGGFEFTHTEIQKLWTKGSRHVSVYESFAWFYAVNTGQISIRHGMRGPSGVLVAEQAGGLDAIGHARRTLRRGHQLMVTGGVESSFDPWGWVSHLSSGRVSSETDPAAAYRPFDATAAGFVPGEGGAILVLEDEAAASARGAAKVYGEIAGYAATFDPRPGSGRPPGLGRAARLAMDDAGVAPGEVDVVFADAAGVAALLSLRDCVIPPTAGTTRVPEDYQLDLVTGQPREIPVRTALVLARGYGGFNSALVLRAAGVPSHTAGATAAREVVPS